MWRHRVINTHYASDENLSQPPHINRARSHIHICVGVSHRNDFFMSFPLTRTERNQNNDVLNEHIYVIVGGNTFERIKTKWTKMHASKESKSWSEWVCFNLWRVAMLELIAKTDSQMTFSLMAMASTVTASHSTPCQVSNASTSAMTGTEVERHSMFLTAKVIDFVRIETGRKCICIYWKWSNDGVTDDKKEKKTSSWKFWCHKTIHNWWVAAMRMADLTHSVKNINMKLSRF